MSNRYSTAKAVAWATIAFSFFLVCMAFFESCKSAKIGCTPKQERKAAKFFYKGLNICQAEVARQSGIALPNIEKDSSWSNVTPGEVIIDTFTHYDTVIINDTVYLTKYLRVNSRQVDTMRINTHTRVTDNRAVIVKDAEILKLQQELSKANSRADKAGEAKKFYFWTTLGLLAIIAISFGIRYIIPKVLNKL